MLKTFQSLLHGNFSFLKESRLLVAVSGGLDSMVLVDLCLKLDLNIYLAHCNFNLRGDESDIDEDFVFVVEDEDMLMDTYDDDDG